MPNFKISRIRERKRPVNKTHQKSTIKKTKTRKDYFNRKWMKERKFSFESYIREFETKQNVQKKKINTKRKRKKKR